MTIVFWVSFLLIGYAYVGYFYSLKLAQFLGLNKAVSYEGELPNKVSIIVPAYNEEKTIEKRIRNLYSCAIEGYSLEVIVASDKSTDNTNKIVQKIKEEIKTLRLIESTGEGKSDAQNLAVSEATGDIIIFTDADTEFDEGCVNAIMSNFRDQSVGAVTGHLLFRSNLESVISTNQNRYWKQELSVRQAESSIGTLCVATGACLGFRAKLFVPLNGAYGDDCVIPLDVVLQGLRVVHSTDAIAFDSMPDSESGELKARIRMTARNWTGTLARRQLLNPIKYPGYAISLVSHKFLKWLSPFLIIVSFFSVLYLAPGSILYTLISAVFGLSFLLAAIGFLAKPFKLRIPFVNLFYSFAVANYGFLLGTLRAISGEKITRYHNN